MRPILGARNDDVKKMYDSNLSRLTRLMCVITLCKCVSTGIADALGYRWDGADSENIICLCVVHLTILHPGHIHDIRPLHLIWSWVTLPCC